MDSIDQEERTKGPWIGVAKIALFVLVPGIHLASMGKQNLGVLFFVLHVITSFVLIFAPYEPAQLNYVTVNSAELCVTTLTVIYIIILALDKKKVMKRILTKPMLALALIFLTFTYGTFFSHYTLPIEEQERWCFIGCGI